MPHPCWCSMLWSLVLSKGFFYTCGGVLAALAPGPAQVSPAAVVRALGSWLLPPLPWGSPRLGAPPGHRASTLCCGSCRHWSCSPWRHVPSLSCEQLKPNSSWSLCCCCVTKSNTLLKFLLFTSILLMSSDWNVGKLLFFPWHSVSLFYIFNLFHSFVYFYWWWSRYTFWGHAYVAQQLLMLALNEAWFLWILKFTLSTGRNDIGDGNVVLWCLFFKTPSLKATWNLSLKAGKEGALKKCLLVNLQFYTS